MGKSYSPNIGETAKIVTSKIKDNLIGKKKVKTRRYKRIEGFKSGKFKKSELKYLIYGIEFIQNLSDVGIDAVLRNLNSNDEDLKPETVKLLTLLRIGKGPLYDFLNMYKDNVRLEFETERQIANLENMYEILQNSRDGIITRKRIIQTKDEKGKEKEVEIEVSMSEAEIANIIEKYNWQLHKIQDTKFSTYLGLGMSLSSILGTIYKESKNSKNIAKTLAISSLISIGTWAGRKYVTKDYKEKVGEKRKDTGRLVNDLIDHEPISVGEEEEKIGKLKKKIEEISNEEGKIENKVNLMKAIDIVAMSILTGVIAAEKLGKAEKINAKSMSQILLEINQNINLVRNIMSSINSMYRLNNESEILTQYEEEMINIVRQIEEKQDPLVEIKTPFEKIEIKNFKGKFYQQKNQETGEIKYRNEIDVPEFSIERGQVVLLSGKSGIGKSTFIRLLKRGDINNRNVLLIDGKKRVDKLGKQFIAVKADKKLGTHSNVLEEITGKESLLDITDDENEKLRKVLQEVKLNDEKILEQLNTKDYSQFSTGQKKRLSLAQALYRTTENPSIILVDEPVGNVEDTLIDEQIKSIVQAIKDVGSMGIIVTHRVDIAQRYVDKHYCIEDDGVMREKKVKEQEIQK